MKNKLFNVIIFSSMFLILYSCYDDFNGKDTSIDKRERENIGLKDLEIPVAKMIFEQQVTQMLLPEVDHHCSGSCNHSHNGNQHSSGHVHSENCNHFHDDVSQLTKAHIPDEKIEITNLVPNWDNAYKWEDETGVYVEVPLSNGGQLFALKSFLREGKSNETERTRVQNMLVFEQTNDDKQITPYIATLIPDKTYLRKKGKKENKLKHKPDDGEFTGFVYISELNGKVKQAFYYTKGVKTHKGFSSKGYEGEKPELNENDFSFKLSLFDMGLNSAAYNTNWELVWCSNCRTYHEDNPWCHDYYTRCLMCNYESDDCKCCHQCWRYPCQCFCRDCQKYGCVCAAACSFCGQKAPWCTCNSGGGGGSTGPTDPPISPPNIPRLILNSTSNMASSINFLDSLSHLYSASVIYKAIFDKLYDMDIKINFIVDSSRGSGFGRYMPGTYNIHFYDSDCIHFSSIGFGIIQLTQYWQFYKENMNPYVYDYGYEAQLIMHISDHRYINKDLNGDYDGWIENIRMDLKEVGRYQFLSSDYNNYFNFLDESSMDQSYNGHIPQMIQYYFR